jgi:hypothetical protein
LLRSSYAAEEARTAVYAPELKATWIEAFENTLVYAVFDHLRIRVPGVIEIGE